MILLNNNTNVLLQHHQVVESNLHLHHLFIKINKLQSTYLLNHLLQNQSRSHHPTRSSRQPGPSTISSLPTTDYSSLYNQLQSVLFNQLGANSLTPREFEEADQIQQAQLLHRAVSNLLPIETSTAKHPLSLPGVTPNNISTIEHREEEDVLNRTDDTEEPNPPEAFVTCSDVDMESVPSLKQIAQTTVNKLVDQGADRSVVDDVERLTPERANTSSPSSTAPYEPTTSPNLSSQLHLTSTSPKQVDTSSPVKPIIKPPQEESPITPSAPVLSISSSSLVESHNHEVLHQMLHLTLTPHLQAS